MTNTKFNIRMKTLRNDIGLSQEALANKLGLTRAAISAYEVGRNEPSYDILLKMSEIFNCDVDYLIGKSSIQKTEEEDGDVLILRRASQKMTPEQRKKALNILKASFDDFDWED